MTSDSTRSKPNRSGRKPGRGWRPWVLIPKVLAVGVYLGAVVSSAALWLELQPALREDPASAVAGLERVTTLFTLVAVPALLLAMVLGFGLFMFHPVVFLRLRWLQIKVLSLLLGVPALHLFMSSRLMRVKEAAAADTTDSAAITQFGVGLLVTLVWTVWLIVLGRMKPRLHQNWGRAFPGHDGKR